MVYLLQIFLETSPVLRCPTDGIRIHIFDAISDSHPGMLQQGGRRWPSNHYLPG
jgi:hypothetical protein